MLQEIRIRGLGVIDDAVVPFHPGLTVLTGETGAGKTMVVSGLGLLLGARADAGLVRAGSPEAVVEGIIDIAADHPAAARAAEAGADVQDDLVVVRTVTAAGRSRAHVGGRSAPVGLLAELAEHLVAVHGQADQWRLRDGDQHRDLLDAFGGSSTQGARTAYETIFDERAAVVAELAELTSSEQERSQELGLLEFGIAAITDVSPQPGEDLALRAESERLGHLTELVTLAGEASTLLSGDDGYAAAPEALSVTDALARTRNALHHAADLDADAGHLAARVDEVAAAVADLAAEVASYRAGLEADPERVEVVEQRRAELAGLTRRYGPTVDEVLRWLANAQARVGDLARGDDRIAELTARRDELDRALAVAGEALTAARQEAATELATLVTGELAHLAMPSAHVEVAVEARDRPARHGADDVQIQLSAGPGMPLRSVTKAASGGELSRIMLAIEVAAAGRAGLVPTYVFDEVDAGIGGAAALDVGARLARLAKSAQVIVVTHLPQVAAYADRHLVVHKADDGRVTASGVGEVTGADREAELARMMTGVATQTSRSHARELLERTRERAG